VPKGDDLTTFIVLKVIEIWSLNLPEPERPVLACSGKTSPFYLLLLGWNVLIAASMGCDFVCRVAIESCKFDNVAVAVRWLLRHMPLISPTARDIEFRMVHPYAAPSEATFLAWNVGKRRAAEVSHYQALYM
jgi:hypothetical protein